MIFTKYQEVTFRHWIHKDIVVSGVVQHFNSTSVVVKIIKSFNKKEIGDILHLNKDDLIKYITDANTLLFLLR